MKKVILLLCSFALSVLILSSCKKDESDPANNNPYNGKTTAQFNPDITYGTMTDQDGNVYKTVSFSSKSGNGKVQKTWMAENLRVTKFKDGTAIPNVTNGSEWSGLTTPAYCSYNNTMKEDSIATFGFLYNFYTIESGKLAPDGWHVPSSQEWIELIWYNGSSTFGGGRMKEAGTTHWEEPNYMGNNAYGFTALPGGSRYYLGDFSHIGKSAYWWTADAINNSNVAYSYYISKDGASCPENSTSKNYGYSIRLVKD